MAEHIEKKKNEKNIHPRQRGYDNENETALRALCGLGFNEVEARRALGIVEQRWTGSAPPIETVLREALAVLT